MTESSPKLFHGKIAYQNGLAEIRFDRTVRTIYKGHISSQILAINRYLHT